LLDQIIRGIVNIHNGLERKIMMKKMKAVIIALIAICLLVACQEQNESKKNENEQNAKNQAIDKKEEPTEEFYEDDEKSSEIEKPQKNSSNDQTSNDEDEKGENEQSEKNKEIVTIPDPLDIHLVVNKQRKLPDGFVPPDLVVPNVPFSFSGWDEKKQMRKEAAIALEELFASAEVAGLDLVAVSGYRSYERQTYLFNHYVETQGLEHAEQFSARPGHSEHQTGLTMDVDSAVNTTNLERSFRNTKEGEWLEKHAHEFGFIIRYPKGKEYITGYAYEPWHIRYVGKDVAKEVYEKQLTLEEFFGLY
jgi:zinc D-Ala-D-Ala carboxypeptidase